MKPDTDPDVFLSEINQVRDELSVLDETVSTERLPTILLDALPAEMYSTVKLEAIRDPDLSLEHIQRIMRTSFVNHSEKVSVTKKNQQSRRYQELNRRGRDNSWKSAMLTALIPCHHCKKSGRIVRNCKIKLEREYEMEKSEKINHEKEKKWCRYHQTNSHSDKQCFQQVEKSKKFKDGRQKKLCSLHNSMSHSNQECFQQKNDSKCKESSTVDGRNSKEHEAYVVDSTIADYKSCCCSNGKIAKKSNESKAEYSPLLGIGFSFACCHPPLFHQANRF